VSAASNAAARVNSLDWQRISQELDSQGSIVLERLISVDQCQALAAMYPKDELFRSRVVMGGHGFGRGEYKYFNCPLPDINCGIAYWTLCTLGSGRKPLERGNGQRN
jgi:hypothetical protein